MDRSKKVAILLSLAKKLKEAGSWCGETHMQKAVFFLQEALGIKTEFDFIIYKHGPFSFELSDELVSIQADNLIKLIPQQLPYGPSFGITESGKSFIDESSANISVENRMIDYIGDKLGDKKVVELERLGTALFIREKLSGNFNDEKMAEEIVSLKPHISKEKALEALSEVEEIIQNIPS